MVNEEEDGGARRAQEAAETLAIEALAFVAADSLLFGRFLRLTGLELENLRQAADEPAFLAGVLDFILGDERTLGEFAAHAKVKPQSVSFARRVLAGTYAEPGS